MSETATISAETPKPARPRRKWRRRLARAGLFLLTLFLVVRVSLFFLLGFVVRNVAHLYGLDVTFGHQQLTLFAGDAGLWDVTVKARGSSHELLRADYVRGKISTFALLSGKLHASRVEADGVLISVQREADGRIQALEDVLEVLAKIDSGKKDAPPKAPNFSAPLSIDAVRLQHVQISLRDARTNPVFQTVLNADLRINDIKRSDSKPATVEADVWAENVLDVLRVRGTMRGSGRTLNTAFTIEGRGLNLATAGGYLSPLGLQPVEFDELRGLDFNAKISFDTDAAGTPTGLTGRLKIEDVSAADADGVAVALQKLDLNIDLIDIAKLHFGKLAIEGGRLSARRTEARRIRFAGLEFVEPNSPIKQPSRSPGARNTSSTTSPTTTRPIFDLALPTIEFRDLLARLRDDAITPKSIVEFQLMQLDGDVKSIDNQSSAFNFVGKAKASGVAQSLEFSGSLLPFKSPFSANVNFKATEVTLQALRGYLAPFGIEPTFKHGSLSGQSNLVMRLDESGASFDLKLNKLVVEDGGEKLQLPEITIDQFAINPDATRIRLQKIALAGPEFTIRHDAEGMISLIGFRIDPDKLLTTRSKSSSTTQPIDVASTHENPFANLPRIELGSLTWNGVRVRLEDESTGTQQVFNLTDAGVDLRDLVIDLNSRESSSEKTGKLRAWLSVPNVAGRIDVDGTFTPGANALTAQFDVKGTELNLVTLSPYVEPVGVNPTLANGSLKAKLKLSVQSDENALSANVELTDASIHDGQRELGGVDRLAIDGVRFDGDSLSGKSITIDKPRVTGSRDENNSIAAMGIRISMPEPNKTPGEIIPMPNIPLTISFDQLAINDASLELVDRLPTTPFETVITSSVKISPISLGPKSSPMRFDVSAAMKDVFGKANVGGVTEISNDHIRVLLDVEARDITLKAVSSYLPPEISSTLQSGQFKVALDAQANAIEPSGRSIKIVLSKLDWRDGDMVLAMVDRLALDAERVDVKGNIVTINSIEASGVESQATMNADGSIQAFGFRFTPSDKPAEPDPEPAIAVTDATGETDVAAQIAPKRKTLPLVTIKNLDLGLKRFSLIDASRPDAAPIELVEASVKNKSPIQAGGAEAESLPPVELLVSAAIKPLTGTNEIHLSATPFAQQPKLSIELLSRGISGEGLTKLVPEISKIVDGSKLVDGQFKAKLDAELSIDRRTPTDFNFARGFGAEINASGIEFRTDPNSEIALGLNSASVSGIKIKPNFAGVTIREVTLQNPIVRAHRDADGIHAMGFFVPLKLTKKSEGASDGNEEIEVVVEATNPEPQPTTQPGPLPEVRIDRLTAQNIDLILEDRSVTPQVLIPINQLDLEVKGLNTLALSESRAIRFNAMVGAGNVSLPKRDRNVPFADRPMEERPLLTRVAATGRMVLFPTLDGYVKVNVSGAELGAFKGLATELAGTEELDGIFDGRFDARFRDGGNLDLNSRLVVTDLSVKEPPDGAFARAFKLPAPIDVVIDAIEDPGGSITLPITVPVRAGEVKVGSVISSGIGAVSQVVLTAFASAPIKLLGGGGDGPPAPDDVVLNFSAGDALVTPDLQQQIESLIEKMRRDKNLEVTIRHDMGSADLERAMIRSNPSREDALMLANSMRAEKAALLAEREGLSVAAQAEVASRPENQADSLDRLRALDARVAEIDSSMSELYDLLKKGAELQASTRQRNAAAALAQARISAVRSLLVTKEIDRADVRVQSITPSIDSAVEGPGRIVISATTKKRAE